MTSWGSDGFENQLKQLKNQLGQKDAQLSTYMQEMSKKDDVLADHKRAKDDALYKLQLEADALLKSEKLLKDRTSELQKANLQIQNMESSMRSLKEAAKGDEKEITRLQYELDSRSNTAASTSRVQEAHNLLQVKVKDLESQLRTAESEKATLRAEISVGHSLSGPSSGDHGDRRRMIELERQVDDLKRDNSRLMAETRTAMSTSTSHNNLTPARTRNAAPPVSPSPRHKRALSMASNNKVETLEAEVDELRARLANSADSGDSDVLKRQYEAAKKESMKLTNQLMATERSSKKEIDAMKEQLDDALLELEDRRRMDDGGGDAKREIEKLKKEIEKERMQLEGKIQSREQDCAKRTKEISELENRIEELQQTLRQRDEEIDRLSKTEKSTATGRRTDPQPAVQEALVRAQSEVVSLQSQIEDLESRLRASDVSERHPPSSSAATGTSIEAQQRIRKLERELETAKRDKTRLEDEVDSFDRQIVEKDAEIKQLLQRVPLPESRPTSALGHTSLRDPPIHDSQLDDLMAECETLRSSSAALQKEIYGHNQTIERLNMELTEAYETLEATKSELRELKQSFELFKGEQEAFVTQRESFDADLAAARTALSEKETLVEQLRAELTTVRGQKQADDQSHKEGLSVLQEQYAAKETAIAEMQTQLAEYETLSQQVMTLTQALAGRSHDDSAVESLIAERDQLGASIAGLKDELREAQVSEFGMKQDRNAARQEMDQLRLVVTETQAKQAEATQALQEFVEAAANERSDMQCQAVELERKQAELMSKITELEAAEADRTSDTEAQQRDEAAFDLREQLETVRRDLSEKTTELNYMSSEYTRLNVDLAASTTAALEQATKLKELEVSLSAKEVELSMASREVQGMQGNLAEAEARHEAQLESLQTELASVLPIGKDLRRQLATTRGDKDEFSRLLQYAELEVRFTLESHRAKETELQELSHSHKAIQDQLQTALGSLEASEAVEATLKDANTRLQTLEDDINALRLDLSDTSEQKDVAQKKLEAAENALQLKTREIEDLLSEKAALLDQAYAQGLPVDALVGVLQSEKRELKAKIGRREAQLAKEQSEARKLHMNLELASASLQEQEAFQNQIQEELNTAISEKQVLQDKLNQQIVEAASLRTALDDVRQLHIESTTDLTEVSHLSNHLILELVLAISRQRAVRARLHNVHTRLASSESSRESLTHEQNALSTSFASLQMDHQDLQTEIGTLRNDRERDNVQHISSLAELQQRMEGSLQNLVSSKKDLLESESQKQQLQSRVESMEKELSEMESRVAEERNGRLSAGDAATAEAQARLKVAERARCDIEAELAESVSRVATLTEATLSLEAALSAAKDAVTASEGSMNEAEERHAAELQGLTEKLAKTTESHGAIQAQLETDLHAATQAKQTELRQASELAAASLARVERDHESRVAELQQSLLTTQSNLESAYADLEHARASHSDLQSTEAEVSTLRDRLQRTQSSLSDLTASHTSVLANHSALSSSLSEAQAKVQDLESQMKEARATLDEADGNERGLIERLEERGREVEELRRGLREMEGRMGGMEGVVLGLEQEKERMLVELKQSIASSSTLQSSLSRSHTEITTLESTIHGLQKQIQVLEEAAQAAPAVASDGEELISLKEENQRYLQSCEQYMNQLDLLNDQLSECQKKLVGEKRRGDKAERKLAKMVVTPTPAVVAAPVVTEARTPARSSSIFGRPESAQASYPSVLSVPQPELRKMASVDTGLGTPGRREPVRGLNDITSSSLQSRSPLPPSSSNKRGREEDTDKGGKVDAIFAPAPYDTLRSAPSPIMPPTTPNRRRSFGRTVFTPNRSAGRERPKKLTEEQNLPPLPVASAEMLAGAGVETGVRREGGFGGVMGLKQRLGLTGRRGSGAHNAPPAGT